MCKRKTVKYCTCFLFLCITTVCAELVACLWALMRAKGSCHKEVLGSCGGKKSAFCSLEWVNFCSCWTSNLLKCSPKKAIVDIFCLAANLTCTLKSLLSTSFPTALYTFFYYLVSNEHSHSHLRGRLA